MTGAQPPPERGRPRRRLEVYVGGDCAGCAVARRLAATVRERRPEVDVRLIDLGAADAVRPPSVFAVPTYLLDGRIVSLGNPAEDWLLDLVAASSAPPGAG